MHTISRNRLLLTGHIGHGEGAMTASDQHKRPFAEKLAHLIATVHPAGRGPYSYREIEAGITDHEGAMTAAFVQQLVAGKQPYPRMHHIQALADFFGVPPAYFFDEQVTRQVDTELDKLLDWRHTEEGQIAQRVSALTSEHRNAVSALLDHLVAYEEQPRDRRRRRKSAPSDTAT
jgi:transcriptional regulator with XRE-family HTH domain